MKISQVFCFQSKTRQINSKSVSVTRAESLPKQIWKTRMRQMPSLEKLVLFQAAALHEKLNLSQGPRECVFPVGYYSVPCEFLEQEMMVMFMEEDTPEVKVTLDLDCVGTNTK